MSFKFLAKLNPQQILSSGGRSHLFNPSQSSLIGVRNYRRKSNKAEKDIEDEYVFRNESVVIQPEKRRVGRPKKSSPFTTVATEIHEPVVNERVDTPHTVKENHKRARRFVQHLKTQGQKTEEMEKPLYTMFTGKGSLTDSGFVF
ncbi:hypothetical protein PPL_06990 [Heterostelium album PN500]|uniref:Uncharacterized protein n=1 Tax=Heterostelium pallidum (strain ATCC 26659 / Pp 5 / PN500) TaxID=670386 RepID=D3BE37_HETP5|nr:hypothetical protein PPL_06990 [Heterostelium album PN500]EFA80168.1 hypothetical protein PPL_06990 [Heterostelium album PN500]|eukprot:XP_020432288.1 hypothetical protein PPL_06990 [Heterostelium album PN500]